MELLRRYLNMELGSITIGNTVYQKATLAPEFSLGPLEVGLYLPIIYNENLLDPDDWYKPGGNHEWDFGFGPDHENEEIIPRVLDFASDLALKIKYLKWGELRDPFFFQVGNLSDITVGHGLIMRGYANDAEFPAVRRTGLNIGLSVPNIGMEAMVNDIGAPEIIGGRIFLRPAAPFFNLAFGLSSVVDINPAADAENAADLGQPIFISAGIDLDFPIVEFDLFRFIFFGDVAAMVPYFGASPAGTSNIPVGFQLNAVYAPDNPTNFYGIDLPLRNFGIEAGAFGNVGPFDWRLSYRDFSGTFRPAFYNAGYERQRAAYVSQVIDYLENPGTSQYDQTVFGIYGEGGFELPDLFGIDFAYMWPWQRQPDNTIAVSELDYFKLGGHIAPGVIPVVDVYGSVAYERTRFLPTLLQQVQEGEEPEFNLFDENTVVSAEIIYQVAPTFDVVLLYTTTLARDATGAVLYDEGGSPQLSTSLGIETRVSF
jgi:hypothetical protein